MIQAKQQHRRDQLVQRARLRDPDSLAAATEAPLPAVSEAMHIEDAHPQHSHQLATTTQAGGSKAILCKQWLATFTQDGTL